MKLCCDPCHPQVSIFSISEMMVIIFFYNISRMVRWILKLYGGLNSNIFVFQTNIVRGHFAHRLLCLVQFFSLLLMPVIVLFEIKSNGVQSDNFCNAFLKLYCHSYIFIVSKQSKYLLWSHKLATKFLVITSGGNNWMKQRMQRAK